MANPSASILADFARLGIGIFSPNLYLLFHCFPGFAFQLAESHILTAIGWTNLGGTGSLGGLGFLTNVLVSMALLTLRVFGLAHALGFLGPR